MAETVETPLQKTLKELDVIRGKMGENVNDFNLVLNTPPVAAVSSNDTGKRSSKQQVVPGVDKETFFYALRNLATVVLQNSQLVVDAVELSLKYSAKRYVLLG
jgi:hypothetical protein